VKQNALNDLVISRGIASRLIELHVSVDDQPLTRYRCDGLIVSSPTGSTAYSLAAGGPVLVPGVEAILLTPICPHSLTHRPLVVGDDAQISVRLESGTDGILCVDGQVGTPVIQGDRIECRKADYCVKLLRIRQPFFDVLRSRLKWGLR